MMEPWFEVWRVEHKVDKDNVDFWDFLDEQSANKLANSFNTRNIILTVRKLTHEEIIGAALQMYKDILSRYLT